MNKIYEYVLKDWVKDYFDISKWKEDDWSMICLNECSSDFLLKNKDKINWFSLSNNPLMIELLENNFHYLDLSDLSSICEWNENLNDFSKDFICKIFEKVIYVLKNTDIYDIDDGDFAISIIDNLCKKINNIQILRKYIPDLKEIGDFQFNLQGFAENPYALPIIFENFHMISKVDFYFNPKAINYVNIKDPIDDSELYSLTFNEYMLPMLKKYADRLTSIGWYNICEFKNKESMKFIENNLSKLNYESLCILCKNKYAIDLINRNFNYILKINDIYFNEKKRENSLYRFQIYIITIWHYLSKNENAIPILEKNIENINWEILSGNKNAEQLLRKYPEKICWEVASSNPSLIDLLKENKDKIVLNHFLRNSALFEIKYKWKKMRDQFESTPLGHGFLPIYLNTENFENWAYTVFDEDEIDDQIKGYRKNYVSMLDPDKNKMIQILNLHNMLKNNPSKKRRI